MNWDLFIPHNYGGLLDDIKKLSTVSRLLLEKGAAYQFDLSLVELALSFPGMAKKILDKLNLLSYQENVDLFRWKYKFYHITDNRIKDCKFFSPCTQFKNKGFESEDTKKRKSIVLP